MPRPTSPAPQGGRPLSWSLQHRKQRPCGARRAAHSSGLASIPAPFRRRCRPKAVAASRAAPVARPRQNRRQQMSRTAAVLPAPWQHGAGARRCSRCRASRAGLLRRTAALCRARRRRCGSAKARPRTAHWLPAPQRAAAAGRGQKPALQAHTGSARAPRQARRSCLRLERRRQALVGAASGHATPGRPRRRPGLATLARPALRPAAPAGAPRTTRGQSGTARSRRRPPAAAGTLPAMRAAPPLPVARRRSWPTRCAGATRCSGARSRQRSATAGRPAIPSLRPHWAQETRRAGAGPGSRAGGRCRAAASRTHPALARMLPAAMKTVYGCRTLLVSDARPWRRGVRRRMMRWSGWMRRGCMRLAGRGARTSERLPRGRVQGRGLQTRSGQRAAAPGAMPQRLTQTPSSQGLRADAPGCRRQRRRRRARRRACRTRRSATRQRKLRRAQRGVPLTARAHHARATRHPQHWAAARQRRRDQAQRGLTRLQRALARPRRMRGSHARPKPGP